MTTTAPEPRIAATGLVAGEPVLNCRRLIRRYGDLVAVDDLSFTISPGETYGLLGPNGAGKTTAISMVAGILTPDAGVRSGSAVVEVRYVARPGQQGQQVASIVAAVVGEESGRLRAARFAAAAGDADFDRALRAADTASARVAPISVSTRTAGTAEFPEGMGRFDVGASSQLLLFIFITSMTSAAALIETRRLGVSRRMLATPTGTSTIVFGEALGRFAVAVVQGAVIMLGSSLVFGVRWGDPFAAVALMLAFGLVATAAGMLLGAVMRTGQQATAIGLLLGIGLAALGGTMMPLEFFSPTMRTIAHFTPHAWAVEGFAELVRHGAGIADVVPQIAVLLGVATVLFGLASWRLRRSIVA